MTAEAAWDSTKKIAGQISSISANRMVTLA